MGNSDDKRPVIPVLTGPTASGKTGLSLVLLEKYPDLHVISADSRQIYRHLDIGTDKPPPEIRDRYNLHLVDFVEPTERYTAFDFATDSRNIIDSKIKAGKRLLVCGGTGLYIKALVEGLIEISEDDMSVRERLEDDLITRGPKELYRELEEIDPDEAAGIHPNNIKRIIRALEIYYVTGRTKSSLIAARNKDNREYAFPIFCLLPPRERLYEKIDRRVDEMMAAGFLDEVRRIVELGYGPPITGMGVIGYAEMFRHLDGELSLDGAVNLMKQNSRRFAKRQITWFRGMNNVEFFSSPDRLAARLEAAWLDEEN